MACGRLLEYHVVVWCGGASGGPEHYACGVVEHHVAVWCGRASCGCGVWQRVGWVEVAGYLLVHEGTATSHHQLPEEPSPPVHNNTIPYSTITCHHHYILPPYFLTTITHCRHTFWKKYQLFFFSNSVTENGIKLPTTVINATTTDSFKRRRHVYFLEGGCLELGINI